MNGSGLFSPTRSAVHTQPQKVHIGRRVDDAQRAIDGEGIVAGVDIETLRDDGLKDVTSGDVLPGLLNGAQVVSFSGALLHCEGARGALAAARRKRLGELALD